MEAGPVVRTRPADADATVEIYDLRVDRWELAPLSDDDLAARGVPSDHGDLDRTVETRLTGVEGLLGSDHDAPLPPDVHAAL